MKRYSTLRHPGGSLVPSPAPSMRDLMLIPYVADGRDPRPEAIGGDGGVDCYGLARLAIERLRLGVMLPADCAQLLISDRPAFRELPDTEAAIAGDGLRWLSEDAARPHLALCIDSYLAIHTTPRDGVRLHRIAILRKSGAKALRLIGRADGR